MEFLQLAIQIENKQCSGQEAKHRKKMLYAVTKLKVHKINTNSTLIVLCLFNPFCENIDFFALHFFFVFPSVQAVEARELETKKERIPSCLSQFLDKNGEFRQIKGGRLFLSFVAIHSSEAISNFQLYFVFSILTIYGSYTYAHIWLN